MTAERDRGADAGLSPAFSPRHPDEGDREAGERIHLRHTREREERHAEAIATREQADHGGGRQHRRQEVEAREHDRAEQEGRDGHQSDREHDVSPSGPPEPEREDDETRHHDSAGRHPFLEGVAVGPEVARRHRQLRREECEQGARRILEPEVQVGDVSRPRRIAVGLVERCVDQLVAPPEGVMEQREREREPERRGDRQHDQGPACERSGRPGWGGLVATDSGPPPAENVHAQSPR